MWTCREKTIHVPHIDDLFLDTLVDCVRRQSSPFKMIFPDMVIPPRYVGALADLILKAPQELTIYLDQKGLIDTSAVLLSTVIRKTNVPLRLALSANLISDLGATALADAAAQASVRISLFLNGNPIGREGQNALGAAESQSSGPFYSHSSYHDPQYIQLRDVFEQLHFIVFSLMLNAQTAFPKDVVDLTLAYCFRNSSRTNIAAEIQQNRGSIPARTMP